ncbi:MAG: hypothetical protein M1142_05435 [Patescibacteria group bacterium]|nr:hypothetical protein [Patescibacteria group bacterium]
MKKKHLPAVLGIVAFLALVALFFLWSNKFNKKSTLQPPNPQMDSEIDLDNDMRALDRDLTSLDSSDIDFVHSYQDLK